MPAPAMAPPATGPSAGGPAPAAPSTPSAAPAPASTSPSNVQRAKLEVEGESMPIECLFNPKDYTVTKANQWKAQPTPGSSAGKPQFGGGNPHEMTLQLLLDASLPGNATSVAAASTRLFQMMEATIDGAGGGGANGKRPPMVTFVWGRFISFKAFAKTLSVQYQLFAPDGQPLRADVKLALIEADAGPLPGQNPTTRADGSMGSRTVREGDSLQSIANETYGDPTKWRALAEANGIDDPTALRRGTALALPRLDA